MTGSNDITSSPLTILIADDHWVVRKSLKQVAQGLDRDLVVEEAGNYEEALTVLTQNPAVGLMLVDLVMPGFTDMEGLGLIRRKFPAIPIVIVSVHEEPDYVQRAIQHGVVGYIPKSSGPEEIEHALRRVLSGEVAFPRELITRGWSGGPAAQRNNRPDENTLAESLSPREREIIALLGQGHSAAHIAEGLSISRQTVRVHIGNAMRKLDLRTREALIRFAVENSKQLVRLRDAR